MALKERSKLLGLGHCLGKTKSVPATGWFSTLEKAIPQKDAVYLSAKNLHDGYYVITQRENGPL